MEKKKIIIYTSAKFWQMSEGMHITIAHQFEIFKNWEIHFVFYGKLSSQERELVKNKYGVREILCVNDPIVMLKRLVRKALSLIHFNIFYSLQRPFKIRKKYKKKMHCYIQKNHIHAVLVNYIWQSDLFLYKGNDYYKIIETHDPQYLFCAQNRKINPRWPSYVTQEDEIKILSQFDLILTVSNTDTKYFKQFLKNEIYYLPFTVTANYVQPKNNNGSLVIGFVGGRTEFNYKAIKWFIDNVFIHLNKDKFYLYVYGNVCQFFNNNRQAGFVLKGFVNNVEEIYKTCDIMVNPALISGGIKTKNIECISHGLPLMTTTSGSKGMEEGVVSGALFSSDQPEEWIAHLNLLSNLEARKAISEKAYSYARSNFSAEKDAELENKISQHVNEQQKSIRSSQE